MKITILSRATCAPCNQLKKYLDYKNLSYEVVDVDENPQEIQGYLQVPVTKIIKDNGVEEVIEGYNLPRLASVLA